MDESKLPEDKTATPEIEIENVLWKLGAEKPELREVIADVVKFLRKKLQMCADAQVIPEWASRLRILREQKKWNQHELAQRVGIDQGSLSRMETGRREPNPELVAKFQEVLGHDIFSPLPDEGMSGTLQ